MVGNAIKVSDDLNNIAIKNGIIAGNTTVAKSGSAPSQTWTVTAAGFVTAINAVASTTSYRNMTLENLQVSGCRSNGIVAYYSTVTDSSVTSNGQAGIYAWEGSIIGCTAKANGAGGITASIVTRSIAKFNGSNGITASSVTSSDAGYNGRDGISAIGGSVTGCTARSNHTSADIYYDLNATDAVIGSTKYGTGNVMGSSIDGEQRTAIESLPRTISTSGSYYLAKSLQFTATSGDAISITAPNVTLDLNGFTLSSTADVTGRAIFVSPDLNNIAIKNGNIAGNTTVAISGTAWTVTAAGFDYGVDAHSSDNIPLAFRNMTVENLQVSGCRNCGIVTLRGGTVAGSTVSHCGTNTAIVASAGTVTGCTANYNGGRGIIATTVTNSNAVFNAGTGINATTVTNSTALGNGLDGIDSSFGSVTNCTARYNHTASGSSYDLNATASVIAFTNYGTGNTPGSTLTGNKTP